MVQSTYDSTIDVFVTDSLADATSVVLQVKLLDVNKSPVSSTFGYYTGGMDGTTITLDVSFLF